MALVGKLEDAQLWAQRRPIRLDAGTQDEWRRQAGVAIMLIFLANARTHARTCGWRWHIVEDAEVAAIRHAWTEEPLR